MNYKFDKYELEDLEYALIDFEKKYNISFNEEETKKIKSFSEFLDFIVDKFEYEQNNDCTTQHIFYLLKQEIKKLNISTVNITPQTKLIEIFPKKNRKENISKLENSLGYKIDNFTPNRIQFVTFFLILIFSLIYFFFNFWIGILGLIFAIFYIGITFKLANDFYLETLGEMCNKISSENYFKFRKNQNSINKSEFRKVVLTFFSDQTGIEKEKLLNGTFA